MNAIRFLKQLMILVFIPGMSMIHAQIVTGPDSSLVFDRTKGILVMLPDVDGAFSLNGYYLTELKAHDTVYIANITPGDYLYEYKSDSSSHDRWFNVKKQQVLEIILKDSSAGVHTGSLDWNQVANLITGRNVYFAADRSFINETHLALFSLGNLSPYPQKSRFNSFTTIFDYSAVPGFTLGVGVTLNSYDLSDESTNVKFLPVFVDFRSYFLDGRATAFLKIDIGYNVFLARNAKTEDYGSIIAGGVFFSPGFGMRVFISEKTFISATFEYSLERVRYSSSYSYEYSSNLNFMKINLGIGFQKKVKKSN